MFGNPRKEKMADGDYKKYTEDARRGIKGESFFETLIVENAIPHRIARQNDLGIDFLCEWINGDCPSGILFLAQIKTTTIETVKPKQSGIHKNGLTSYTLSGAKKIDDRTLNYWKGLGLPAFLFLIIEDRSNGVSDLKCYCKRCTPLLDGHSSSDDRCGTKSFYLVNEKTTFLAFSDLENETGGFARDLIIDYARLSYSKGHVVPLTPKQLGFWPFPDRENLDKMHYFEEFIGWNRSKIKETCELTSNLLNKLPEQK